MTIAYLRDSAQVRKRPFLVQRELLERDSERAAVEGLIGAAPAGWLLAIERPPGIGKTALIAEAKARGNQAATRVMAGAARNSSAGLLTESCGSCSSRFLASLAAELADSEPGGPPAVPDRG